MKQIVCITAGCMFFALMLSACRTPATQLKEEQNMGNQMIIETPVRGGSAAVSSPRVFVYKTKGDYSHLVPVLMDDSRTQILSYPHPRFYWRKTLPADSSELWLLVGQQGNRSECRFPFLYL